MNSFFKKFIFLYLLTIVAYAEVVKRNGSVYEHNEDELGHHIHVDFLDAGFYKQLGLTYAETIHVLTPKKDKEKFYKIFGWYSDDPINSNEVKIIEFEEENEGGEEKERSAYNEKTEVPFVRTTSAIVKVNLFHNRIQNQFLRYLGDQFPSDINLGEKNRIDATRETESEVFIYEIKPFESVYRCIRDGIGQLLDYSHQLDTPKQKRILIVGPNRPNKRDSEFISAIKDILQLPFGYIAFDESRLTAIEY